MLREFFIYLRNTRGRCENFIECFNIFNILSRYLRQLVSLENSK